MKLLIQTYLSCSPESAWQEVKKPSLLNYVAYPVITFKPVSPALFLAEWPEGESVQLKTYLLGCIPFGGVRTIYFESIRDTQMQLQTREQDALIRRWDHLISIQHRGEGGSLYTDSLDLDAGMLTGIVWLFAQFFYRHRQRRWRKLALSL